MTKRKLTFVISGILFVTILFIGLGLFLNESEIEKRNGLTALFDVNQDGTIAFVYENKGKQEIYIQTNQKQEKALQLDEDERLADIRFSPNGALLLYSLMDTQEEKSSIHVLDTRSFDTKEILQDKGLITEIDYHPEDNQSLFYLKAMTFENYSPIASARPHDFDVFSYDIKNQKETRYTHLKAYAMSSLQVSNDGSAVYLQMFDDENANTADDIFDAKQKVFYIPLDQPEQKEIVSNPERTVDIYDIAIMPNEDAMIFQSISNEAAGETYQYELYYYDFDTKEEKQLTDVQTYAGRPIIGSNQETIYFIVNERFAKSEPEYHLFKMKLSDPNPTEVDIDIKG